MSWKEEAGTQVEARSPSERALALAPPRPHLYVVLDCARPDGASRHDLAEVDEVRIGRGHDRSSRRTVVKEHTRVLEITLPDPLASLDHARIVANGEGWVLEDAGARNGTWVDGVCVPRAELHDGAVIQIGRTLLVFRSAVPTPISAAADVDTTRSTPALGGVVTLQPWYAARLEALARIARSSANVLLLGETGTGKEVLARAVHAVARADGPFVAVNCGAIPLGLVESQLFGHVKGAFSGAVRDELGFVRAAHGGTLFLDEIVDLPRSSQAALLRVLQEREVVPVGSTRPVSVDIRVVAATHADVEALVQRGELRADLLARISGFVFHVPPLRERREDVGVLASQLLARLAPERTGISFDPDAAAALLMHGWRHNVRELEHALTVALALADQEIGLDHLPPALAGLTSSAPPPPSSRPADEDAAELRVELARLLAKHAGNVSAVAREMGRARPLVHRWLKRYRIDAATFRGPSSG
jgi:DNA-binding NtrC family response regulator